MKTLRTTLAILSLAVLFLAACKKNNFDNVTQPDLAAFNVVNASPGQSSFNFAIDNSIVNGPALVFTDQTGYLSSYSGTRKFDLTLGGTAQSILTDTLNMETNKYYSVFIVGQTPVSTLITEDDLTAPASGKAKLRFIPLSPDGGALTLGIKDGPTLFTKHAYKSVSEFIAVDPAQYTMEIKDSAGKVLTQNTVTITAGKVYTVWAGGLLKGTGNSAMVLEVNVNN